MSANVITIDEAINRIQMGPFQREVLFATGTCFMADSMQVMLLSFLTIELQREWGIDDTIASAITSCLFAGAMTGTLILGPAGDRIGRKPILICSAILISCFGLGTALCNNYITMMLVILMVGFGIGGLTVPFDILAEFLPTEKRGRYLLMIKYFWTAGSMLIPVLAYISIEVVNSWRLFTVFCAVPCILSAIISILFVPESPRWLVSMGRKDKALKILRKAALKNGVDPDEMFPEGIILADEEKESSNFAALLNPRWRKLTLTLWAVWAGFAFSYYSVIMTITRLFDAEEEDEEEDQLAFDYIAIFISASSELVGTALAIMVVDSFGRVKALVAAFLIGGSSLFMVCVFHDVLGRSAQVGFAFLSRASEMAAACITWISTAELLSTNMRSTGHSAANAIARSGACFSPFLVNSGTLATIGIVIISVNIVTAFFASKLPETAGIEMGKAVYIKEEIERKASSDYIPPESELL
mmetsp:Transcript_17019/g.19676  ORF Transcript_17019/g.19676 Transcript_17019/m.19676 type:complete len:472 (-) Transcript_17019:118-1533(-)